MGQDWKEMVHDPEVGAIVVGSPTPFHAEQIIEAAKLGKHIFCEKVCSVPPQPAPILLSVRFGRRWRVRYSAGPTTNRVSAAKGGLVDKYHKI